MNFYLKDTETEFQFPVNPENIEISGTHSNNDVSIYGFGQLSILESGRNLYTTSLSSFFPDEEAGYSFLQTGESTPTREECINQITQWFEDNVVLQLVIEDTEINMFCTITEFTHGLGFGSNDRSFTIGLQEYREVVWKDSPKKIPTKKKVTSYKWKKKDTWTSVCRKCLGSSKDWKRHKKNNKSIINTAVKAYKKKHGKAPKKESTALIGYEVTLKL